MKIAKVERYGALRFERLMVSDYSKTRRDMLDKYAIKLPTEEALDLWHEDDLRMLLEPVMIVIYHSSGEVWIYTFRTGWMYDTGSVPKVMRSVVDNDERRLMVPTMVHDANFRGHWLRFGATNKLFRKMMIWFKYPRFRAGLAWFAVSSFVGAIKFKRFKDKKKVGAYRKFVSFSRYPKRDVYLVEKRIRRWELDKVSQID